MLVEPYAIILYKKEHATHGFDGSETTNSVREIKRGRLLKKLKNSELETIGDGDDTLCQ